MNVHPVNAPGRPSPAVMLLAGLGGGFLGAVLGMFIGAQIGLLLRPSPTSQQRIDNGIVDVVDHALGKATDDAGTVFYFFSGGAIGAVIGGIFGAAIATVFVAGAKKRALSRESGGTIETKPPPG